jgi:hypothetical protein
LLLCGQGTRASAMPSLGTVGYEQVTWRRT